MKAPTRSSDNPGFWTDAWSVARNLVGIVFVVLAGGITIVLITHLIALPLRLLHWIGALVR